MYGRDQNTFDESTEELATAFASYAAVAVANTGAHASAPTLAAKLQEALDSRGVIDQAKGVLMAEHRYSADAAFAELVRRSRGTDRPLRDVAQEILDEVQRGETK